MYCASLRAVANTATSALARVGDPAIVGAEGRLTAADREGGHA